VRFSAPVHTCVGAPLARMELRTAIPELLRRLPDLRLADGANDVVLHVRPPAGDPELVAGAFGQHLDRGADQDKDEEEIVQLKEEVKEAIEESVDDAEHDGEDVERAIDKAAQEVKAARTDEEATEGKAEARP